MRAGNFILSRARLSEKLHFAECFFLLYYFAECFEQSTEWEGKDVRTGWHLPTEKLGNSLSKILSKYYQSVFSMERGYLLSMVDPGEWQRPRYVVSIWRQFWFKMIRRMRRRSAFLWLRFWNDVVKTDLLRNGGTRIEGRIETESSKLFLGNSPQQASDSWMLQTKFRGKAVFVYWR